MTRIERVARTILKHSPKAQGPLASVLAELELTLTFLDSTRDAYARADSELEAIELAVGTELLKLHYDGPSQQRDRLTQRLHEITMQRRRLALERNEHDRRATLELLRLVNTHATLQGH